VVLLGHDGIQFALQNRIGGVQQLIHFRAHSRHHFVHEQQAAVNLLAVALVQGRLSGGFARPTDGVVGGTLAGVGSAADGWRTRQQPRPHFAHVHGQATGTGAGCLGAWATTTGCSS